MKRTLFYEGPECGRCGSRLRYASSNAACVACTRQSAQRRRASMDPDERRRLHRDYMREYRKRRPDAK